jgi:peptide/nickel transport system substrate-binding protein
MLKFHKIYIYLLFFSLVSCTDGEIREELTDKRYGGVFVAETGVSFEGRINKIKTVPYKIGESAYVQIFRSVFETLTRINPNTSKLESNLAKSWDVNEDGTQFTFFLRTDVFFHDIDGVKYQMKAVDVKKSFNELSVISKGNVGYAKIKEVIKGVESYNKSIKNKINVRGGVSGVIVINDSTIRFDLKKPYTPFPQLLSNIDFSVFRRNEKTTQALGTGPFVFDTNYREELHLKRNTNYWKYDKDGNRLPYLSEVVFKKFEKRDIGSRLDRFLKKEVHLMKGIRTDDISTVMRVLREENDIDFGYESIDNSHLAAISLNNSIPPFNNVNVRKAFNYAFDKNLYIDSVLNGEQWVAENGLTPIEISNYKEKITGNKFNLKKAKQFLAKAGYPKGKGFPTVVLSVVDNTNHPLGESVSQTEKVVMGMICEELNVKLEFKKYSSFGAMFYDLHRGRGMASLFNYTSRYTSPESYLNVYNLKVDSSEGVGHDNTMFFRDDIFDDYYNNALQETDEIKRNELFYKAERRIIDQSPIIPIYYGESNRILSKEIVGLSGINNLSIIDYTNAYLKQ